MEKLKYLIKGVKFEALKLFDYKIREDNTWKKPEWLLASTREQKNKFSNEYSPKSSMKQAITAETNWLWYQINTTVKTFLEELKMSKSCFICN